MTANRLLLTILPAAFMIAAMLAMFGIETWLSGFGTSPQAKLMLGRIGLALPYAAAAAIGVIALFATAGAANIKTAGLSVLAGASLVCIAAIAREGWRLFALADRVPHGQSVFAYTDPSAMLGAFAAVFTGIFALRVAIRGNGAFAKATPRRISGKRAVHGEADWMKMADATFVS